MKLLLSRRGRIILGMALMLALFLVRPGAQRLRTRIVRSISLALGRPVDVGSVTLRFLPQPGFELEGFVVHEDPAFGAEPALQSSDVLALVRVRSLLHGRLEIARLSLTEPSLNLVRNAEGHWNLENLIERAARSPIAPTAKASSEVRPGFPYIEADHGRINFKFGPEKKPYTLTDANFALWQDSENTWAVRLKAQPMRTDFNLSDTGLLEVEGSWQRAADLHQTPLQFAVQWEGAQLGQVTKLTLGQDKGWRGAIALSASLRGTPEDLAVAADATVQDFRRYDIASDKPFRLAGSCKGHYSTSDHALSEIACGAPVGDGSIAVNGNIALLSTAGVYDLTLLVQKVPVQPLVELARRVKKNVPADLVAAGRLDADVALRRDGRNTGAVWRGGGALLALNASSPVNNVKLALDKVPFAVSPDGEFDIGPFGVGLGSPTPASVRGQLSRSGYSFAIQGSAEVQRLLAVARTSGLPAPQLAASGAASINLHVGGSWADFAAPAVAGTALLNSIHARLRGLQNAIEITSASVSLTPTTTDVQKLTVIAAGSTWRGSIALPRKCAAEHTCPIRFDLHADEFSAGALAAGSASGKQPWYRFLTSTPRSSSSAQPGSNQTTSYLASVHAIGKLSAARVLIHNLVASHVSTDVELEQGRLQLKNLRGEILGGHHTGDWAADFTVNPPTFSGSGGLEKVALAQLAEAMQDSWITGTANFEYRASTLGWSKADLLSAATGSLQVEARDGSLPHLILTGESSPLRINRLLGQLRLRDEKFAIEEGKLQTPSSIYQISGTASLDRVLDIKLVHDGARGFNITGTLTEPHVVMSATPETQAALKP